jgi:hypothetical protein
VRTTTETKSSSPYSSLLSALARKNKLFFTRSAPIQNHKEKRKEEGNAEGQWTQKRVCSVEIRVYFLCICTAQHMLQPEV